MKQSFATIDDLADLASLINSAYRATAGVEGWTHEGHLLDGTRITEALLLELINTDNSVVMLCKNADGKILASVHLQKQEHAMYFGMLAVDPAWQSKGIGSQMVQFAKSYAKSVHCTHLQLTVLTQRIELVAWYQRLGFAIQSKIPFPDDTRFGIPKQPLELLVMICNLDAPATTK